MSSMISTASMQANKIQMKTGYSLVYNIIKIKKATPMISTTLKIMHKTGDIPVSYTHLDVYKRQAGVFVLECLSPYILVT